MHRFWGEIHLSSNPALPLTSYMTLEKVLGLSELQFSYLFNENNKTYSQTSFFFFLKIKSVNVCLNLEAFNI